jgi:hypothetical protein
MMAKRLSLPVLVLLGACTTADLFACGDKFLVISRGTRFQRSSSARSAADILIYASSASTLPTSLARIQRDDSLRKAGYRPVIVENTNELDQALKQGAWSLLIADLPEARVIRDRIRGLNAPMILPVALSPTGTEIAEAKKDFQRIVKGPIKSQAFLMEIDDALALWQKLQRTKPTV